MHAEGPRLIMHACLHPPQSFAKGADMEDLGCVDAAELKCAASASIAVAPETAMPAWLKAHNEQVIRPPFLLCI